MCAYVSEREKKEDGNLEGSKMKTDIKVDVVVCDISYDSFV